MVPWYFPALTTTPLTVASYDFSPGQLWPKVLPPLRSFPLNDSYYPAENISHQMSLMVILSLEFWHPELVPGQFHLTNYPRTISSWQKCPWTFALDKYP